MIRNDEGGIELDDREAKILGLLMVSTFLADDEAIEWEDLPELTESSFEAVLDVFGVISEAIEQALSDEKVLDAAIELYEEVS